MILDAVSRHCHGVLGNVDSISTESFNEGLLEYPQYTRPPEFRGLRVPDVLVSGNHGRVDAWRREQATRRTRERRPDLMQPLAKPRDADEA